MLLIAGEMQFKQWSLQDSHQRSSIVTLLILSPTAILSTTSWPWVTWPKTVYCFGNGVSLQYLAHDPVSLVDACRERQVLELLAQEAVLGTAQGPKTNRSSHPTPLPRGRIAYARLIKLEQH